MYIEANNIHNFLSIHHHFPEIFCSISLWFTWHKSWVFKLWEIFQQVPIHINFTQLSFLPFHHYHTFICILLNPSFSYFNKMSYHHSRMSFNSPHHFCTTRQVISIIFVLKILFLLSISFLLLSFPQSLKSQKDVTSISHHYQF